MLAFFVMALFAIEKTFTASACQEDDTLKIISREEWGARDAKHITNMSNPVPYVIIHHSYIPGACNDTDQCKQAMRDMQDFHMDDREWWDIGYSFGVGGDGLIYEGRGWTRMGAHAPKYNDQSIGICTIGDWRINIPPPNQLKAVQDLIAFGVRDGRINKSYKLLGHRQTRPTECPGQALFDEIKKWPHFSSTTKEVKMPANTL
ncbi:peptidoglycan-recognition protein LB-like [Arctopsyche grandis]|uniref:peptidoglycan-recognition protein LB-like n=1 Tax=Arctopsyche grandis TaxID=121162 RepID=UPI00406D680B